MGRLYDEAAVNLKSTQYPLDSHRLTKPNITTTMASEGQKGKRLLANVIDFYAKNDPTRVWATAPMDDEDLLKGYEDITYRDFANAINRASWWLSERSLVTAPSVRILPFSYISLYLGTWHNGPKCMSNLRKLCTFQLLTLCHIPSSTRFSCTRDDCRCGSL